MSTHVVPVIRITEVRPHPNADRLELIPVGGWVCSVRKGDFKVGDLAVYIEPDFMVPVDRNEFAFLKDPSKSDQTHVRIRGKKLRGVMSFGLLIPVPLINDPTCECCSLEFSLGDNLLEVLGIYRWEPPVVSSARIGDFDALSLSELPEALRSGLTHKFDLENFNNYPDLIDLSSEVVITEKIHGANARYMWWDGVLYVGSRSRWLKPATGDKKSAWQSVSENTPNIGKWCEANPGVVLYGEIYGNVQDFKYGIPNGAKFAGFAAFDLLKKIWRDTIPLFASLDNGGVERVPVLSIGQVSRKVVDVMLELDSSLPTAPNGHMREGVVITPYNERFDPSVGRVSLKLISNRYWERKL